MKRIKEEVEGIWIRIEDIEGKELFNGNVVVEELIRRIGLKIQALLEEGWHPGRDSLSQNMGKLIRDHEPEDLVSMKNENLNYHWCLYGSKKLMVKLVNAWAEEEIIVEKLGDINGINNIRFHVGYPDEGDNFIVEIFTEGWEYGHNLDILDIDDPELRVLDEIHIFIPFKKICDKWVFIESNAFNCGIYGDYILEKGVYKAILKPFSESWKYAMFARTPEERLWLDVNYLLLVPSDSNPLTILLRSPQPTKGIAKQIENLLRKET